MVCFFVSPAAIASPTVYSLSGLSSHHNINFNCAGSEENLLNCSFNRLINYSCPLNRDANVFCQGIVIYNAKPSVSLFLSSLMFS